MEIYSALCLGYLVAIFCDWRARTYQISTARRTFGLILIAIGVLLVISNFYSIYSIQQKYGYNPDSIRYKRLAFEATFFCGWGAFLMVCVKPYRALWRRISIFSAYVIFTFLLIIGTDPFPKMELQVISGCFVSLFVILYLKEMHKVKTN